MYTHSQLIYHRGRHGEILYQPGNPFIVGQNSVASMIEAMREGATMVEFDARLGTDPKEPVIAHDPGEARVPTMREILDVINGNMDVNIEIKDPAVIQTVLNIVDEEVRGGRWKPEQIVFSSFHHETALFVKTTHPQYRVGVIMDAVPLISYIDTLAKRGIDNLHMEWMNADMDMQNFSTVMARARMHGMRVWVWTVNDLAAAQRVYDWGADRIFTDRPELFPR